MKKIVLILITVALVFLSSCSTEPIDAESFQGTWKLTEWSVNIPIDLNNDIISSTNLLEEIDCVSNETLVFDNQGTVVSNLTFNPKVDIALINASTNEYQFLVECDTEGIIASAASYTKNNNTIIINNRMSNINDNELIMIYENAIKIYNEDFTSVIETKNLKLVYTKL